MIKSVVHFSGFIEMLHVIYNLQLVTEVKK